MIQDCLFCKFIRKEIPVRVAYEDDKVLAFHDIHPQAPVHVLLVPKRHLETVEDAPPGDSVVSLLAEKAVQVAKQLGISENGFRLVMNCRKDGGQTIYHLHLHLLGGRPMSWPPG